jgi:hypothetical protein
MHRFTRLASFATTALLLQACPEVQSCGAGLRYDGTSCVDDDLDAGNRDAEAPEDTGPDSPQDGGPCGGDCPLDFCDTSTNMCLECRVSMGNTDCVTRAESVCDAGSCVACTADSDCDAFVDTPECGADGCVACDASNEGALCDGFTCNQTTGRCTDVLPGDIGNCETCVGDSQCPEDHRCVLMFFDTVPRGGRCLKDSTTPGLCEPPFSTLITRASLSGVLGGTYCGVREDLTTCEAVLAFSTRCRASMSETCPMPGSVCRTIGATPEVCTYPCTDGLQCQDTRTCPAGADRFCQ